MLSIIYNGIKPNEYKFEYSVIDNNKVDFIDFSFSYLPEGTPFVKIESKDKKYVDKIDVSEYVSSGHIVFPLLAKTTAHKVIRVQLSFETSETKWQTEVVEITLKNSVRADEEIANNYPTALKQIEIKVSKLHPKSEHNFIKYTQEMGLQGCRLTLPCECRVLLTENVNKCSKLVRSRYIDKKQGNKITGFWLPQGSLDLSDVLSILFGNLDQEYLGDIETQSQINAELSGNFSGEWVIYEKGRRGYRTFFTVLKEDLNNDIQSSSFKIANALKKSEIKNSNNVIRLQFKFVKDFEWRDVERKSGWKGTMASVYLDCLVYIFRSSPHIYISPMIKRF